VKKLRHNRGMHKIDSYNAGPGGVWLDEDPLVPRDATAFTPRWCNAVQQEIAGPILAAGIALRASGAADETAGYASQLLEAIEKLNPVKAACVVDGTAPAAPVLLAGAGVRNVASVSMEAASGGAPKRYRVTFASPIGTPIAAAITPRDVPGIPQNNTVVWPQVWRLTSTYVEFIVPMSAVFVVSPAGWTFPNSTTVDSHASFYDVVVIGTGA